MFGPGVPGAGYYQEGFLQLQHGVDSAIIDTLKERNQSEASWYVEAFRASDSSEPVSLLQMFPDPPQRHDDYVYFINDYMPMVLLVSFLLAVAVICKDLVLEKEKKLKVGVEKMRITACTVVCMGQVNGRGRFSPPPLTTAPRPLDRFP